MRNSCCNPIFQTYEKWKQSLPDTKWLEEYMPSPDKLNDFRNSLIGFSETVVTNVQNVEIGKYKILVITCLLFSIF